MRPEWPCPGGAGTPPVVLPWTAVIPRQNFDRKILSIRMRSQRHSGARKKSLTTVNGTPPRFMGGSIRIWVALIQLNGLEGAPAKNGLILILGLAAACLQSDRSGRSSAIPGMSSRRGAAITFSSPSFFSQYFSSPSFWPSLNKLKTACHRKLRLPLNGRPEGCRRR